MRKKCLFVLLAVVAAATSTGDSRGGGVMMQQDIPLGQPKTKGQLSLEETISRRRSRRSFSTRPLTLAQVGQLLWCAQGITDERSQKRASPSAGATYPLEVFIAVGKGGVDGLEAGVYRYVPSEHALERTGAGDIRARVAKAALGQQFLAEAPVDLLVAADYDRTTRRYGERGIRYVHMEVGHVGQNVYLQAEALGLGTVVVGAFRDELVARAFGLPKELRPLCIMPVGHARSQP